MPCFCPRFLEAPRAHLSGLSIRPIGRTPIILENPKQPSQLTPGYSLGVILSGVSWARQPVSDDVRMNAQLRESILIGFMVLLLAGLFFSTFIHRLPSPTMSFMSRSF